MLHSARRINEMAQAIGARHYLEIGVWNGHTFCDVAIAERTAVDPTFGFNVDAFANDHTHFVRKTSDDFFATEPPPQPYDLVFIDGLHTFEQTLRDFLNVLIHSHDRTVILIDDTLPNDVYSCIPEIKDAIKFRSAAGGPDLSWHGDVFKLVFFIHDFCPGLNYRTIVGAGNPQTMVWRARNLRRSPLLNDLERISRLTYFDLHAHIDVLQQTTEDEAMKLCLEQLAKG